MAGKIKIIVADDHPAFRSGIEMILKQLKFVSKIAAAENGIDVLAFLKKEKFDLVLMDINMKPMDGMETTQVIKKNFPEMKVMAMTMRDDVKSAIDMFELGADGYLLKCATPPEIENAITQVMIGERYISQTLRSAVWDRMLKQNSDKPSTHTKYHQQKLKEIIYLISNEFTSHEIADIISLSTRTIEEYRAEILSITNSHNTVGIVKYAISNGIDQDQTLRLKFKTALEKKANEL